MYYFLSLVNGMELPNLGENCSLRTCNQLGMYLISISVYFMFVRMLEKIQLLSTR